MSSVSVVPVVKDKARETMAVFISKYKLTRGPYFHCNHFSSCGRHSRHTGISVNASSAFDPVLVECVSVLQPGTWSTLCEDRPGMPF